MYYGFIRKAHRQENIKGGGGGLNIQILVNPSLLHNLATKNADKRYCFDCFSNDLGQTNPGKRAINSKWLTPFFQKKMRKCIHPTLNNVGKRSLNLLACKFLTYSFKILTFTKFDRIHFDKSQDLVF